MVTRDSSPMPRRALLVLASRVVALSGGAALLAACGASQAAVTGTATSVAPATAQASASVTSSASTAQAASTTVATSATLKTTASTSASASAPASAATGSAARLRFWGLGGTQPPGPTSQQIVDEFNKAHQTIQVELDNKPQIGTASPDALTAAIAGGEGPDVVYLGIGLIQGFAAASALAPLDQYTAKGFSLDDYYPQFLGPPTWHGKLYGIPYVPDARGLYWNKDLYRAAGLDPEQPPKTVDDLQRMSAALTKVSGGTAQQLGFVPGWGNPPTYLSWNVNFWALGGEIVTPDHLHVAYNTAQGIQALQTMVDQMKVVGGYQATVTFSQANKPPSGLDVFSAGRVGMFDNGAWALKTYGAIKGLDYGVGPLPVPPGGKHVNFSGCPYLSITQGSKHADDAWQLIAYLESPDPLLRFNVADTTLPPRKSVANSSAFLGTNPDLKYFVGELEYTHLQLYIPGTIDIFKVFSQMYTDVISGKVTPADGIANSVVPVQAILDKNAASM